MDTNYGYSAEADRTIAARETVARSRKLLKATEGLLPWRPPSKASPRLPAKPPPNRGSAAD